MMAGRDKHGKKCSQNDDIDNNRQTGKIRGTTERAGFEALLVSVAGIITGNCFFMNVYFLTGPSAGLQMRLMSSS